MRETHSFEDRGEMPLAVLIVHHGVNSRLWGDVAWLVNFFGLSSTLHRCAMLVASHSEK
jgi:hypothetical protein